MFAINVTNIVVLDNPAMFTSPFQFEVTFECLKELSQGAWERKLAERMGMSARGGGGGGGGTSVARPPTPPSHSHPPRPWIHALFVLASSSLSPYTSSAACASAIGFAPTPVCLITEWNENQ